MKKVFLIRHAESKENTGEYFDDSHTIPLTEDGTKQAEDLAKVLEKPKRIIVSRFLRSQQTAIPLIEKYKDSEVHFWIDAHEFEPHDHKKKRDLKKEERKEFFLDYWKRCDPFIREMENSETFQEVFNRVLVLADKLQRIPDGINYIFTHYMIIKILIFICENQNLLVGSRYGKLPYVDIMKGFAEFNLSFHPQNAQVFDITELLHNLNLKNGYTRQFDT